MGQEVRPPAKHAIDHFKELHRQDRDCEKSLQILIGFRFNGAVSKLFYDNQPVLFYDLSASQRQF